MTEIQAPQAPPAGCLQRRLGLTSAIMITVGAVIGSGIFLKALTVAQQLPDEPWIYGTWVALGVVCLFGAFAYAELGAMLPEAGGQYSFLREGWGQFVAFLYGWVFFWAINSGTMAALAVAFGDNLLPVFGVGGERLELGSPIVAASMVLGLAWINHRGVGWGAVLQNVSTFAKLGAIGLIVAGGFAYAGGGDGAPASAPLPAPVPLGIDGVIAAAVAIFWAYEGWYQLPFNAAELRRPERDLPRGLIYGMVLLIGIYLLVNAVYLHVVPLDEMRAMANAADVPRTTIGRVFGSDVAGWLSVLIAVSVMGAANPNLLSSPRAFYEMAKDGLVPRRLMHVHPRYCTPTWAIWGQALWAIVLIVVLKTFRDITDFVVFTSLIFYAMTVAAVYVLRWRQPDRPRPHRCVGYPWTPAVFLLVAGYVIYSMLAGGEANAESRANALRGLVILAAGVPFFFIAKLLWKPVREPA